jgi:periplasmic divalent cation tolerance protein
MILVYVTCEDKKEAEEIGRHLLKKRLAACINIFPKIKSVYWGSPKENKLETSKEASMFIKTRDENFPKIEKEIKKLHSYSVSCIISIKIDRVHKPFLDWLMKETK